MTLIWLLAAFAVGWYIGRRWTTPKIRAIVSQHERAGKAMVAMQARMVTESQARKARGIVEKFPLQYEMGMQMNRIIIQHKNEMAMRQKLLPPPTEGTP